ncbi:hypothetical protein [Virgibacillus sp. DJP39]|uniref:hypothetical protein n=1 Tax=Virgibacillus sp. DJP39 TaxID=3409790 RepID=UPI003BB63772
MDKQLNSVKNQFKKEIPVSFTASDKQAVLQKINSSKPHKRSHILPSSLTAIVYAALLFAGFVVANDQLGLIEFGQEDTSEVTSPSTPPPEQDNLSGIPDEEEYSTYLEADDGPYQTFDPQTIEVGDVIGEMKVTDVKKHDSKIIVTFEGKKVLNGELSDEDVLMLMPDEKSLMNIPFAQNDIGGKIPFFFQDSEGFKKDLGIGKFSYAEGFNINVNEIRYTYSSAWSRIDLGGVNQLPFKFDSASKTTSDSIRLSDELLNIYSKYAKSLNDKLLKGLEPFDIFRMYFHTQNEGNSEVQYALYIKGDHSGTPSREEFFNDPFFAEDEITKENSKKLYQKLLKVKSFEEKEISDNETVIMFKLDESNSGAERAGFRLIKDPETGVWKVGWMSMQ